MTASSAGFVQRTVRVPKSAELTRTLERAFLYAEEQGHGEVLLDHLLLALTEDRDAAAVIVASGVDVERLRNDVAGFVSRLSRGAPEPPHASEELLGVIDAASAAASQSRRRQIDGAVLLSALIGEGKSPAAELLRAHGLTFEAAIETLRRRTPQPGPPADADLESAPGRHHRPAPALPEATAGSFEAAPHEPASRGRVEPLPPRAPQAGRPRRPPPRERQAPAPAPPRSAGERPPAGGRTARPQRRREATPQSHPPRRRPRNANVEDGLLVENIPRRMTAGRPETVEVRIGRRTIESLGAGMRGDGAPVPHDVLVTRAMSVRLRAPEGGFFIETASPETQWIDNDLGLYEEDYASWRFTVTPRERGWRSLQLVVSARSAGADGLSAETALPEQTVDVRVGINIGRTCKRLLIWLATLLAGGAIGAVSEGLFLRMF